MPNRTIMALWKARSLSPEQKVWIVEEESEETLHSEESGSFLGIEDADMLEVFSSTISVDVSFLFFSLSPLHSYITCQKFFPPSLLHIHTCIHTYTCTYIYIER